MPQCRKSLRYGLRRLTIYTAAGIRHSDISGIHFGRIVTYHNSSLHCEVQYKTLLPAHYKEKANLPSKFILLIDYILVMQYWVLAHTV